MNSHHTPTETAPSGASPGHARDAGPEVEMPPKTTAAVDIESAGATRATGIDYRYLLDCVHCGLCTSSCPTYVETLDENNSPRGRIYLMRAVTDGRLPVSESVRQHLELCLDCRACETACPSGVQYGRLIEPFRIAMEQNEETARSRDWFHRWVLLGLFPYPDRLRRALLPARIAQRLGVLQALRAVGAFRLLPARLRQLVEMLPPPSRREVPLPRVLPAEGKRRARVALFTGCVGDVMFRHTHWATARVLQKNGCDVVVPREQVCCGAIHFHAGQSEPARALADQNLSAFDPDDVDAVIVDVAGCGAMLKDYGHHWADDQQERRQRFAQKVRDVHEFLDSLGLTPPEGPIAIRATYHDACHLAHAQGVREAPRRLLAQIPELELVELPESELCCGAAGTYNLEQPEMSRRLSRRKLDRIRETGASTVVTGNAGCLLQIAREARQQGEPLWLVHPVELLDMSYRGQLPQQVAVRR